MLKRKEKVESLDISAISVADFLVQVNASLLSHIGRIQGEVTSVKKDYSTAIYFSIKDTEQDALLNCIIWRSTYVQNGVSLEVGDQIIVTGTPEIYAPRGTFSLKVQTIEYAGEGALKKAYEDLKKKLYEEGLLDIARKRELPKYPKKIGVITSRAGVVIQDFSANLGRYGFKVTMVDSRVEGKDAIHELLASIKTLSKQDIDVLVIMRGGGSWESLQAFNTESVVRAIAGFKCPVLTGIGHDVDVTLSELVADVGASTPTAVAESLNETWDTLSNSFDSTQSKIISIFDRSISKTSTLIDSESKSVTRAFSRNINDFSRKISNQSEKIRSFFLDLERKIVNAVSSFQNISGVLRATIRNYKNILKDIPNKLKQHINDRFSNTRNNILEGAKSISSKQKQEMKRVNESLVLIERSIRLSDPSHNLRLGYSLSYVNGKLARSIKDIKVGEVTETHLSDGTFISEVKDVK